MIRTEMSKFFENGILSIKIIYFKEIIQHRNQNIVKLNFLFLKKIEIIIYDYVTIMK